MYASSLFFVGIHKQTKGKLHNVRDMLILSRKSIQFNANSKHCQNCCALLFNCSCRSTCSCTILLKIYSHIIIRKIFDVLKGSERRKWILKNSKSVWREKVQFKQSKTYRFFGGIPAVRKWDDCKRISAENGKCVIVNLYNKVSNVK